MKILVNKFLIIISFIHRMCPFCIISRRFPKSKFAKAVFLWSKVCPCCNVYLLAKKRNLI
ncbi:MAG: hypothetical protein A3K83_07810 [Omnitrophica WOR_2 bacterium RBG_13_44_8b]|nr:MAG: hypothetical protein A3K83_07810 [Omnitrophica WOR_2 bacterium RBG_13_44_8b]